MRPDICQHPTTRQKKLQNPSCVRGGYICCIEFPAASLPVTPAVHTILAALGMASAVSVLMQRMAMAASVIWVWRLRDLRLGPMMDLERAIAVSARDRRWEPVSTFHALAPIPAMRRTASPRVFGASFSLGGGVMAAPVFGGMTGLAPMASIARWQEKLSWPLSALTTATGSLILASRPGSSGPSWRSLPVRIGARISAVSVSTARCSLRQTLRLPLPCWRVQRENNPPDCFLVRLIPFALAEQLQPGRVDGQMQRPLLRPTLELRHRQISRPPRQGRGMRHRDRELQRGLEAEQNPCVCAKGSL